MKSKDFLLDINNNVKKKGKIDKELIEKFELVFPNKYEKVLEVIRRGITRYNFIPSNRTLWIAMGENNMYLIHPKIYCSCRDFYNSVVIKRKNIFCKHLLAQAICEALGYYKVVKKEDFEIKELIKDMEYEI